MFLCPLPEKFTKELWEITFLKMCMQDWSSPKCSNMNIFFRGPIFQSHKTIFWQYIPVSALEKY
jgi:hypothetical protein